MNDGRLGAYIRTSTYDSGRAMRCFHAPFIQFVHRDLIDMHDVGDELSTLVLVRYRYLLSSYEQCARHASSVLNDRTKQEKERKERKGKIRWKGGEDKRRNGTKRRE